MITIGISQNINYLPIPIVFKVSQQVKFRGECGGSEIPITGRTTLLSVRVNNPLPTKRLRLRGGYEKFEK